MNGRTTMMIALLAGISMALSLGTIQAAHAAPPVALVGGGGLAVFDDPRFEGVITPFGLGVTIRSDGSAKGHFTCIIRGVLANTVQATSGSLNPDGSVTFSGPAIAHFAGGGTFEYFGTVTVTAGGPGVGTFCIGPPVFPDTPCDHETVINGNISIKTP